VELIGVPAVGEVAGIYNWASDGDIALVDGDHGLVRVNPPRRERDAARVERESLPSDDDAHGER
jgi:phosphotransferase system enzyme I (PtsP)